MILAAWGVFFDRISGNADEYDNMNKCEVEYNEFLGKLHEWVSPNARTLGEEREHLLAVKFKKELERIDWIDVAIKGIAIGVAGTLVMVFLPAAPGVMAGLIVTAGMAEGLTELYEQFKRGEDINWPAFLTRTFGGALKGTMLVIPGINCVALGGVAAIGTLENYMCSLFRGDGSLEALGAAAISGGLEGITAGGLKWFGDKLVGKLAKNKVGNMSGKNLPSKTTEVRCQELTDEELANVFGGASNPDWKPSNFDPSKVGGHHVHAKAAFKGDISYNPREGLCISQKFMEKYGIKHKNITIKQRELFKELAQGGRPNTIEEHTRIAKEALKAGFEDPKKINEQLIEDLVEISMQNLTEQGVLKPTRIPWSK